MSYSTLNLIQANGDVVPFQKTGNSYHGCILIWREFAIRYKLCPENEASGRLMSDMKFAESIWDLPKKKLTMPLHEKVVMLSTFDRHAIKIKDKELTINAFVKFHQELPDNLSHCHLKKWAEILGNFPTDCLGFCFQHSSVSKNLWIKKKEYNSEDYRPYNVLMDDDHKWVFDQIV